MSNTISLDNGMVLDNLTCDTNQNQFKERLKDSIVKLIFKNKKIMRVTLQDDIAPELYNIRKIPKGGISVYDINTNQYTDILWDSVRYAKISK